ncbi:MAG: hypothetical protein IJW30_05860 [Clostridia bacterium]|nr:hypothetical protein [Clostridia bacterium]
MAYNRPKRNMLRLIAILLLLVGTVSLVPSGVLAKWLVLYEGTDTSPTTVKGGTGDITVNYHFFGEQLFVPAQSTTTYYKSETDSTVLTADEVAAMKANVDSMSSSVSKVQEAETGTGTTSKYYRSGCDNTAGYGTPSTAAVTIAAQPTLVLTLADGSTKTLTVPAAKTYTSPAITGTGTTNPGTYGSAGTLSDSFQLSQTTTDGITTTRFLDVYAYYTPATVSITSKESSDTYRPTSVFGSCCWYSYHYKYDLTVTFTTDIYYTTYVREEVSADSDTVQEIGVVDGTYSVSGYSVGDTVIAPTYSELISVLPTDVQGRTKSIQGYYSSLTGSEGTYTVGSRYQMPLTIVSSSAADASQVVPTDQTVEVWVKLGTTVPSHMGVTNKTDYNSLIGSTDMMLASGVSGVNDVTGDIAYAAEDQTFALTANTINGTVEFAFAYDASTAKTNVNAGKSDTPSSTLNIRGQNGLTDKTASLSNNTCDYTVVLQNDLVINGTLMLGGYTGADSATSTNIPQGYMIRNYVALDLNGHTVTVNGTLHSFGHIYDSTGKGKIVVGTSGTLYTQLLIHGMSGLQHTLKSYDVGYCPFEDYNMPYLEATVEILTETTYTKTYSDGSVTATAGTTRAGTMYGFTMMNLGSYAGAFNCYLKLFGVADSSDQPLFSTLADPDVLADPTADNTTVSGTAQGRTVVRTQTLDSLSTSLTDYCTDKKNLFDFYDILATLHAPKISFTLTVTIGITVTMTPVLKLERVIFPISAFVDVSFHSSELTLGQQIIVMPGCTMTFDEDSVLRLTCSGSQTFDAVPTISYINPFYGKVTKNVTGGIFAPIYDMDNPEAQVSFNGSKNGVAYGNHSAKFWEYFGTASVNVYGTLEMAQSPTGTYVLAGNINVNDFCTYNTSTGVRSATAEWRAENLDTTHLALINLRTYGGTAALSYCTVGGSEKDHRVEIAHHYVMPMISNGTSYAYWVTYSGSTTTDQLSVLTGTYQYANGVFTTDAGETYVILPNVSVPAYNANGLVSYSPTVTAATVNCEIAVTNDVQYVYYAGTYSPVATGVTDPANIAVGDTCTVDGLLFISTGTGTDYTQTLTWNGTKWNAS